MDGALVAVGRRISASKQPHCRGCTAGSRSWMPGTSGGKRFRPILNPPCDLCQINEGIAYAKINHQVDATASRIAWQATNPTPIPANPTRLAQKRLEVMVAFQPWQVNPAALIGGIGEFNQTTPGAASP